MTRDANPARMERWAFSDLNPWMWWVKASAEGAREPTAGRARQPVRADGEESVGTDRGGARPLPRCARCCVRAPVQGAVRIALACRGGRHPARQSKPARRARADLGARGAEAPEAQGNRTGSRPARWSTPGRGCFYLRREGQIADERPFNLLGEDARGDQAGEHSSLALKAALKRQASCSRCTRSAIAALPALAPDMQVRRRGYEAARKYSRARRAHPAPGRAPARASPRSLTWSSRRRSSNRHEPQQRSTSG